MFALTLVVLIAKFLPETRLKEVRTPLSFSNVMRNYIKLCRDSRFLHYAAIPCFVYAAYFFYIAESPFLLEKQGMPREAIGFSYIILSVTYVSGNLLARRLIQHRTLDQTLAIGYKIFLIGSLCMLTALWYAPTSYLLSIVAISILTLGNGCLLPLGTAGAITSNSTLSGSASGLMGCLQLTSAALAAQLIGILSQHQPQLFGIALATVASVGFLWHHTYALRNRVFSTQGL